MLDDAGGTGLDSIRDAGARDVVLAASVEPYARATIEGAQYAAARGVPVVALTDSEVSPLARVAAAAILVATDSPSFFHTMTPLLAVAEILAALVAGRGGNKALAALEHTEAQLSAFGVHLPRRGAKEAGREKA
jgi:DNA-binding MurR/RpiR family transcriptional regulator